MSWDVLVFATGWPPPPVRDDFEPGPLGSAAEVRATFDRWLGPVDWSDSVWGFGEVGGAGVEFNLGRDDPVPAVMLHVRGGGDVVPPLIEFSRQSGWGLLDCSTGDWLTSVVDAGWDDWQEFRDQVVGGAGEGFGSGMLGTWPVGAGVVQLPSGRYVRGRGLAHGRPDVEPEFGVYLGAWAPKVVWEHRWVRCLDFGVPDAARLRTALSEALRRCRSQRVEIGCRGGVGRTGLALACLAILDGLPASEAVRYVRLHYKPGAVETSWQRRFVERFG